MNKEDASICTVYGVHIDIQYIFTACHIYFQDRENAMLSESYSTRKPTLITPQSNLSSPPIY